MKPVLIVKLLGTKTLFLNNECGISLKTNKKIIQIMRTNWLRGSVPSTPEPLPPVVTVHPEQKSGFPKIKG